MQRRLFVGETLKIEVTVADRDGIVFTPDTVTINAKNPSGTEVSHTLADNKVYEESAGVYRSYFALDEAGDWVVTLKVEYDENGETIIEREEERYRVFQKAGA